MGHCPCSGLTNNAFKQFSIRSAHILKYILVDVRALETSTLQSRRLVIQSYLSRLILMFAETKEIKQLSN